MTEKRRNIPVTPKLKRWLIDNHHCPEVHPDADEETIYQVFGKKTADLLAVGDLTADKYCELTKGESPMSVDAEKVFSQGSRIRVKDPSESYSTKRYTGRHAKTGQEVLNPLTGRNTELPSQMENACVGVLLKHLAQRSGLFPSITLPDHEKALLHAMCDSGEWAGNFGGEYRDYIPGGGHVKALIDDATSGGTEITPIVFDDAVVTFPLLTGELLPRVDLVPVDQGRRIMSGSVANPTVSWGQGDGVEVDLFDTAAMVAPLDTTVFGCAVAVTVGRDFMVDAGVNVGTILTTNIGQRMQAELDKIIALGNGSSQPEGIATASGLGTMNADNGTSGPPTLNDYTSMMFGIAKQYRTPAFGPAFISNDTTYQRSRSIRVDPNTNTVNQLPVLAPLTANEGFSNYVTLGWPHAIQNDMPNGTTVFGALKKFRLYRRLGMDVQWVQGGLDLARQNLVLLVVRARYGGRVMDPNAFVKWVDGQS